MQKNIKAYLQKQKTDFIDVTSKRYAGLSLSEKIGYLERYFTAKPNNNTNVFILHRYGSLCLASRKYTKALGTFKRILTLDKNNGAALQGLGKTYFAQGAFEKAGELFSILSAQEPDSLQVFHYLGLAQLALKQFASALATFEKQRAVNPAHPLAYNNLGKTHLAMGNSDEALTLFTIQLLLEKGSTSACNGLGEAYLLRRDIPAAKGWFRTIPKSAFMENLDLHQYRWSTHAYDQEGKRHLDKNVLCAAANMGFVKGTKATLYVWGNGCLVRIIASIKTKTIITVIDVAPIIN